MAAATARGQTDLEQRLIRSDPVFARLATVIGWIKPSVKGTSNQLSSIRLATERFAHCWDELLPDERERALDLVLACFCDLESGVEGWTMVRSCVLEHVRSGSQKLMMARVCPQVLFKDLKVGAKRSGILVSRNLSQPFTCVPSQRATTADPDFPCSTTTGGAPRSGSS